MVWEEEKRKKKKKKRRNESEHDKSYFNSFLKD